MARQDTPKPFKRKAPEFYSGKGKPPRKLGTQNSHYMDTTSGDVYRKTASGWQVAVTIASGAEIVDALAAYDAALTITRSQITDKLLYLSFAFSAIDGDLVDNDYVGRITVPAPGDIIDFWFTVNKTGGSPTGGTGIEVELDNNGVTITSTPATIASDSGHYSSNQTGIPAVIATPAVVKDDELSVNVNSIGLTLPGTGGIAVVVIQLT